MIGPVWRLAARLSHTNRALRREVAELRQQNLILTVKVGAVERERDQFRRDVEMLALMARDRRVALAFVADAHRIAGLGEVS